MKVIRDERGRVQWTPELFERVNTLRKNGLSWSEVSKQIGIETNKITAAFFAQKSKKKVKSYKSAPNAETFKKFQDIVLEKPTAQMVAIVVCPANQINEALKQLWQH